MDKKDGLLNLLDQALDAQRAFINSLSDAERAAEGRPDAWVAKDILAHVTGWNARVALELEAAAQDETPPPTGMSVDEKNAVMFEENRHKPWATVADEAERTHARLVAGVRALPEDVLMDPARFAWQNNQALWRRVAGTAFTHALMHYADFDVKRGRVERAVQVQEEAAQALLAFDDSPQWRGVVLYNLACGYALAGRKERAIELLGEALRLNPDLVAWSREDPDLVSLRDEPAYRALYAE